MFNIFQNLGHVHPVLWIAGYLVGSTFLYMVSQKLNESESWWSFVPILNLMQFAKLGGMPWFMGLLYWIPLFGWVLFALTAWKVAERRGKSGLIGLLMCFPVVQFFALGFLALSD